MKLKLLSALKYYLISIPTIILGIRNFYLIPLLCLKKPVLITLRNGLRFKVRTLMEVWTIKEVCLDHGYEPDGGIPANWTIIDIGASIGDFAIMNDKKSLKIVSFEMNGELAERMRENMLLNNCTNIRLFTEAAKDLGEILLKNDIAKCDLLKMDCEGCEYILLNKASRETFEKIDRIILEYHLFDENMKENFASLKKVLSENGYAVNALECPVHSYLGILYAHRPVRET